MTLVITDGEFWWSWRELNPRPKFLHTIRKLNKSYIYQINHVVSVFLCQGVSSRFKALPPICRHISAKDSVIVEELIYAYFEFIKIS